MIKYSMEDAIPVSSYEGRHIILDTSWLISQWLWEKKKKKKKEDM